MSEKELEAKKKGSEKLGTVRVVAITLLSAVIIVLAAWLITVTVLKAELKKSAEQYMKAEINSEFDVESMEVFSIALEEANEAEICDYLTGVEDIRAEIISQFELEIDADNFVTLVEYTKRMIEADRDKLSSLREKLVVLGLEDSIDVRNIDKSLETLDELRESYMKVAATKYINEITTVCGLIGGYGAIDNLLEENSQYSSYKADYGIDTSILEMRGAVESVMNSTETKAEVLEYCTKINNLIQYYGAMISFNESTGLEIEDETEDDLLILEYLLAGACDELSIGLNIMTDTSLDAEEAYIEFQNKYGKFVNNQAVGVLGLIDTDELALDTVKKAFIDAVEPTEFIIEFNEDSLLKDNLCDIWQVNLIYGGIFEDITSKAGLTTTDTRLGLMYRTVLTGLDEWEYDDTELTALMLWTEANQALFANIYSSYADEYVEIEEELRLSYESLFNAMSLNMDNIYYGMDIY